MSTQSLSHSPEPFPLANAPRVGPLTAYSAPDVSAPETSPEELMDFITRGGESALAELYDRYSTTLLGLARQVVTSPQDAEEVVQEVFVQIWRQASQYDPRRASVSTWLLLITRRKAIDRLRKEQTCGRALAEMRQQPHSNAIAPEGSRRVLALERRARILRSLQELPQEQRQVLELAYYRGLTQRQIAERLAIPLGTVKTRSVLALKKLRRSLHREANLLS